MLIYVIIRCHFMAWSYWEIMFSVSSFWCRAFEGALAVVTFQTLHKKQHDRRGGWGGWGGVG